MHEDKPQEYNCSQCEYKTKFQGNLNNHIKRKHLQENFPCSSCPYVSTTQSSLKIHKLAIHKGVRHKCTKCEQQFTFEVALKKHIQRKHSEESSGVDCKICFLRLSCKYTLQRHMRKHTGERPYKCENVRKASNNQEH